jgi:hypothetical protein
MTHLRWDHGDMDDDEEDAKGTEDEHYREPD